MAKRKKETVLNEVETDDIAAKNIARNRVSDDKFISAYCNDLQVQITPWDFRLILGLISDTPGPTDPRLHVSTLGELRMSPQLAKRLLIVLATQVKNYENNIGPIPLPES